MLKHTRGCHSRDACITICDRDQNALTKKFCFGSTFYPKFPLTLTSFSENISGLTVDY